MGRLHCFAPVSKVVCYMSLIVFIHPEGNHLNNPTLYEVSRAIAGRGALELFLPGDIYYSGIGRGFFSRLLNKLFVSLYVRLPRFLNVCLVFLLYARSLRAVSRADVIVGVDHYGVIQAELLASFFKKRLVFFSFEIMFSDEFGSDKKAMEIAACKDIDFCVIQDRIRAALLVSENNISAPVSLVPIGNSGLPARSGWRVRDDLGIPKEKKVAIIIGSLAGWTCASDVVRAFCESSDETWCLIVHGRFDGESISFLSGFSNTKIFVSSEPMDFDSMSPLFDGVDVGLAFYRSVPNNPFLGRNIEQIGLASGKISNYLRHGVPVMTNINCEMADLIRSYNAGVVLPVVSDLFYGFSCLAPSMNDGASNLFVSVFDFSKYEDQLMQQLLLNCDDNAK